MDPTVQQWRFRDGDVVVGADGATLGRVTAVLPDATRPTYLHVTGGHLFHHEYYLPLAAVTNYQDGTVYAGVTKDEIVQRGWEAPPAPPTRATAPMPAPPAPPAPVPPPVAAPAPAVGAVPPAAPAARPEPSVNDLRPLVPPDVEAEPMLLLDTTGSMSYAVAEGSTVQRRAVIGEAIGRVVEQLAAQDAQAAKEQAAGEDAGGLLTVTFADGTARDIGDLSPANWRQKWAAIEWGGGTQIMPGWHLLVEAYREEFGARPEADRPRLLALVITDGEADDTAAFAQTLAQAKGGTFVCVAILGFGAEHDQALAAYRRIAAANDHVRVVTFGSETDPGAIAAGVLSLLGQAA